MIAVTVSPKFQVVIPQAVRDSIGLRPGAKMMVVQYGDTIRLLPVKPAAAYRGIARGIDTQLPAEPDPPALWLARRAARRLRPPCLRASIAPLLWCRERRNRRTTVRRKQQRRPPRRLLRVRWRI